MSATPSPITLPSALARASRFVALLRPSPGPDGSDAIPALLAHPDWSSPRPTVIWMHGRTVSKELDNGRYLRWLRAGIATCALDLPGHGARLNPDYERPARTIDLIEQAVAEVDLVLASLAHGPTAGLFDPSRLAIGGMSAGGMVTLRRLCEPHPFGCAAVEGTAGDLEMLYSGSARPPEQRIHFPRVHTPERVARIDPMQHLATWRAIPLLALHSRADEVVPVACIERFISTLRAGHVPGDTGDPEPVRLHTWPTTGAAKEHNGFGRVSAEAKALQLEFLAHHLGVNPSAQP